MATIHIDGKKYEVSGSKNLLEACLTLGIDVPYFCWHPALGSVGSCRQCAVKQFRDKDDKRGRIVMSCMVETSDDIYISIEDDEAKDFRRSIVEWLMTNHPHDCPVCAEGGNCHLQDMTVMMQHSKRRYRFTKRTHKNQNLGPFIAHEMNRCIACYRCVRFYQNYADGKDFGVFGANNNIYFGRVCDGNLESEFSGNLIEICPTGVFTDKTHTARYNRKWDMQFAPSICQQCSVGCNISPGERYGELRRIENRYNNEVNYYFLCDRGRFGYGYVNAKDRPRSPVLSHNGENKKISDYAAIDEAIGLLNSSIRIVAIGSPRASLESNFALNQLVGEKHYFTGIEQQELDILKLVTTSLQSGAIYTPSLKEIETYDAIFIIGEDITQTAARIALAVRQAIKGKAREIAHEHRIADWQIAAVQTVGFNAKYPLFTTNIDETRLNDISSWHFNASPKEQARFAFAVAHAIDPNAPKVNDLSSDLQKYVDLVAEALKGAKKPLIITGSSLLERSVVEAALNVTKALESHSKETGFVFAAQEVNSFGVACLSKNSIDDAFEEAEKGKIDLLIVLENDLYRRGTERQIEFLLNSSTNIIVIDHQNTKIMDRARLALSSTSFAESDGTVMNNEGRLQRFYRVFDPTYYDQRYLDENNKPILEKAADLSKKSIIYPSWHWLIALRNKKQNKPTNSITQEMLINELIAFYPFFSPIKYIDEGASFRIQGQKIARSPQRYSGRTSILANISVHEPQQPQDLDSAFAFSMEGYSGYSIGRKEIPFAWAPGWNSPQAWNKFQSEIGGELKGGVPGVRLFKQIKGNTLMYFDVIPTDIKSDELIILPYYHLFGSEELSQKSNVIQERSVPLYIMLNKNDAEKLSLSPGRKLKFDCNKRSYEFPVKISENLQSGFVGLPIGFSGLSPALVGEKIENIKGAVS